MTALRIRKSIEELQNAYQNGDKKPLETVIRAWKGIQELPPDDPNSFFVIGGYHGEPFRGAGWGNSSYWGGYCNHGNVLFPTWHRAYLLRLENALRSIPGCEDFTLPFWDETSPNSINNGVPWSLTVETFELDGKTIPNPLASFTFSKAIVDHIGGDDPNYSKPKGYTTVRYPLSGLVGSQEEIAKTKAHNARFPNHYVNVGMLNSNIINWLSSYIEVGPPGKKTRIPTNVAQQFADCLNAPNYTVFSNTSSAGEWNDNLAVGAAPVVPLEQPHNDIHLAVGGYDVSSGPNAGDFSAAAGANGDMGENDTAALDPIFYFHHCNVDRMFWIWQKKHGATDALEIIAGYPGTNSVDNQGPTPGVTPNSWLGVESPLDPFKKADGTPYATVDVVNIERQLGYTYGPGSFDGAAHTSAVLAMAAAPVRRIHVSGINRGAIRGSFVISAFGAIDGEVRNLGSEGVLSRWHVEGCANCQTHLQARAAIPIRGLSDADIQAANISVEVMTRDGPLTARQPMALAASIKARAPFRFEIR